MTIPSGILQPTTPPEPLGPRAVSPRPEPAGEPEPAAGQGRGVNPAPEPAPEPDPPEPRPGRARRSKVNAKGQSEKVEGRRLYLSESVHFRLRMLAYQRGQKISEVAEEVLDKALPKWDVTRSG